MDLLFSAEWGYCVTNEATLNTRIWLFLLGIAILSTEFLASFSLTVPNFIVCHCSVCARFFFIICASMIQCIMYCKSIFLWNTPHKIDLPISCENERKRRAHTRNDPYKKAITTPHKTYQIEFWLTDSKLATLILLIHFFPHSESIAT